VVLIRNKLVIIGRLTETGIGAQHAFTSAWLPAWGVGAQRPHTFDYAGRDGYDVRRGSPGALATKSASISLAPLPSRPCHRASSSPSVAREG
jgi:hypothetical protein